MRHSRKSGNSNLHSENRHRNRNYKRRVRNLFLEIIFITILIFIANKFIKNDEEKAHVKQLSVENQKQQIEKELQENNIKKDNTKELEIPQQDKKGIRITKVNITCDKDKTIIDFVVKNYNEEETGELLLVGLLNNSAKIIEKIYVDVPILKSQQQTKINLVVDKDLTEAERIELLEEK